MKTLHIKSLSKCITLICLVMVLNFKVSFAQVFNIPEPISLSAPPVSLPPVPNPDPLPPPIYPVRSDTTINNSGSLTNGRISEDSNTESTNETTNALQPGKLQIYPNPNSGEFTINFHSDMTGSVRIRIINIIGKEIFSQNIGDFTGDYNNLFDLSDKGRGIYILSIEQNNKEFTKKIVIN